MSWAQLPAHESSGRAPPCTPGFDQHRLAQRFVPRVCRLHADKTVSQALDKLVQLAEQKPTAIMCAEAVPWRCHRSLIADALTVRGYEVRDIMSAANARPHALNPMARVHEQQVTYPPEPASAGSDTAGNDGRSRD
jgi:hypothetical protein